MATTPDHLGVGFRFPFRPNDDGRFDRVSGPAIVRQAIETLLDTEPGERLGLPTFGCGLRRFLMAPNTVATRTAMAHEIDQSLSVWEPRIVTTNVTVTPGEEPSLVWIEIVYVHRADRSEANLVYPFYLRD
jgi:uncharacterized protein